MPTKTDPEESLRLAKEATRHLLNAICDDPRKYWLMGVGTESWVKLTAAHAALWELDVAEVRKNFQPDKKHYQQYCEEREAHQKLLTHCRENGIRVPVR